MILNNSTLQIKIVLTILLFLCLLDMPYGFYTLVRFAALVGFGILAFKSSEKEDKTEMIIFGALALLFQPFFRIALGREMWNIVDVIVGGWLVYSVYRNSKEIKSEDR